MVPKQNPAIDSRLEGPSLSWFLQISSSYNFSLFSSIWSICLKATWDENEDHSPVLIPNFILIL
ncbi:hypothetical protein AAZX31_14G093000 [Glycine max]